MSRRSSPATRGTPGGSSTRRCRPTARWSTGCRRIPRATTGWVTSSASTGGATGSRATAACGGLIAPNGAIRLSRATTLVAWHDGVEHYLTSFSYQGQASSFGWIVPLPAVPAKVEEGGDWTLQRLFRETHPQRFAIED